MLQLAKAGKMWRIDVWRRRWSVDTGKGEMKWFELLGGTSGRDD